MYKIGLYPEWGEHTKDLSMEDKGKLFDAMFKRNETGDSGLDGYLKVIFGMMQKRLEIDKEAYKKKCEKNREIALEREKNKRTPESTNVHERTPESTTSTNSNSNSNTNTNILPTEEAKPLAEKKVYGDPEINELLAIVKEANGGICDGKQKEQRQYGNLLLKKLKEVDHVSSGNYTWQDYFKGLLLAVGKNQFHSHKITGPKNIYYKLGELQQVAKQTAQDKKNKTFKKTFL